jgi:Tol biopolymer transport system component
MCCRIQSHLIALVLVSAAISGCGGGGGGGSGTPVPAITTISPVGASAGNAAFTLTVLGSGFSQSSTVQWNGVGLTTLFFSGSTLHAQVPASDIATIGTATVTVNDTAGGLSNSLTFTVAPTTIVFQSTGKQDGTDAANTNGTQNIWVMDANGANRKPFTTLTALAADNRLPVWAPDGSKIAYASERALDGSDNRDRQNHNIWVGNADGSNQKALTPLTDGGAESFAPVWSPDGTKIAYVSTRKLDGSDNFNPPNLTTNIWLMNPDGTNQRHLTALTANEAGAASPVRWSPDSTQLVFPADSALDGSDASGVNHTRNLWIARSDGSGLKPLTKLTAFVANSQFPAWSPDGTKIAYLSTGALNDSDAANTNLAQNIWVINPDGSNAAPLTQLTAVNVGIFAFAWSPDGSKIAFVSARPLDGSNTDVPNGTAQNLWVMDSSGLTPPTHVTGLTAASHFIFDVAWTAGGTKLLYSSNRATNQTDAITANNVQNIWQVDLNGTNTTALTSYTALNSGAGAPAQP